jgi:DNA polymerase III subunit beta
MRLSCPYAPLLSWHTTESAEAVDFHFTSPTKPAILRGHGSDDHGLQYALMPVRLTG